MEKMKRTLRQSKQVLSNLLLSKKYACNTHHTKFKLPHMIFRTTIPLIYQNAAACSVEKWLTISLFVYSKITRKKREKKRREGGESLMKRKGWNKGL